MIVTEDSDDGQQQQQPQIQRLAVPSQEHVTAIQVNTLLRIAHVLSEIGSLTDENGGERDGGTVSAVEGTLIKTCDRLDSILEDAGRWSLAARETLDTQIAALLAARREVQQAQVDAVHYMSAPHRVHTPQLMRLADGLWVAILGDPKNWNSCVVGKGSCPAEAFDDFDAVFNGAVTQELKYENEQLDGKGPGATDETPSGGGELGSNLGEDGAVPERLPPPAP